MSVVNFSENVAFISLNSSRVNLTADILRRQIHALVLNGEPLKLECIPVLVNMPRKQSTGTGRVEPSSSRYINPRKLRRSRTHSQDSENYDIESWRDKVETMRTKSRLCERGRLYDHLNSNSVLDRAIEALTSHKEPMYRPEGRGRRGCFGEMQKVPTSATTTPPRRRRIHSTADSDSEPRNSKTNFSYKSDSRTTVTTIKEFIYNDAGFPRPAYVEDFRKSKANVSDTKRSSKILEKEISDIVDKRRQMGDKQTTNDRKMHAYSNLPNADGYEFVDDSFVSEKKPTRRKSIRPDQKDPSKIDKKSTTNGEQVSGARSRERKKSTARVKFEVESTDNGDADVKKPKSTIDWAKVNEVTGAVKSEKDDQKLLKTFAQLYTDKSFGDEENIDREVTAYKTSGRATLGQVEEPEVPLHLRTKETQS